MLSRCCSSKPAPKVKDLQALTDVYAALADPTRLRMLALLRDGEICVCHIHASLAVPQPTASRHLAYLRKAGLVSAALHALSHTAASVTDDRRLQVARKAS